MRLDVIRNNVQNNKQHTFCELQSTSQKQLYPTNIWFFKAVILFMKKYVMDVTFHLHDWKTIA